MKMSLKTLVPGRKDDCSGRNGGWLARFYEHTIKRARSCLSAVRYYAYAVPAYGVAFSPPVSFSSAILYLLHLIFPSSPSLILESRTSKITFKSSYNESIALAGFK